MDTRSAAAPPPAVLPPPVTVRPRIPLGRRLIGLGILAATLAVVGVDGWRRHSRFDALQTVNFSHGGILDQAAEPTLHVVAALALNHPDARIAIIGHTGTRGDPAENQALSALRARTVKDALVALGVKPGRIDAEGAGASDPLPQRAAEPDRAWQARLGRADIHVREP